MYAKNYAGDPQMESLQQLKENCRRSANSSTRFSTYLMMNPELDNHPIYGLCEYIPDSRRIAFTRLRLSSHRLRIETGRWTRTPREQRLCVCDGSIQDEIHALFHCARSEHIRDAFNISEMPLVELFQSDQRTLCELLYLILCEFD